jgi:hypothetical protein
LAPENSHELTHLFAAQQDVFHVFTGSVHCRNYFDTLLDGACYLLAWIDYYLDDWFIDG